MPTKDGSEAELPSFFNKNEAGTGGGVSKRQLASVDRLDRKPKSKSSSARTQVRATCCVMDDTFNHIPLTCKPRTTVATRTVLCTSNLIASSPFSSSFANYAASAYVGTRRPRYRSFRAETVVEGYCGEYVIRSHITLCAGIGRLMMNSPRWIPVEQSNETNMFT